MDYVTLTETEWEKVNQVWELLDQGDIERARTGIDALLRARPGHPDLRIVDAAVALEEGEAGRALEALDGAQRSADPALYFHLRASALFDLVRLEEACDAAERAVAVHPDLAEAHDLLSRLYEHLGDEAKAREHAAEAQAGDPSLFTPPYAIDAAGFDALVEESLKELPPVFRRKLEEVPVLVDDLPRRALLTAEDPPLPPDILGLFVGRSLLERTHLDLPGAPEAIYLFRRNLVRVVVDREELKREIRITVQHEVAHLLGYDEDEMGDLGLE